MYSGEFRRWRDQRVGLLECGANRTLQKLDPWDRNQSDGSLPGYWVGHNDVHGVAGHRHTGSVAVRAKYACFTYIGYRVATAFAVVNIATAAALCCSPPDPKKSAYVSPLAIFPKDSCKKMPEVEGLFAKVTSADMATDAVLPNEELVYLL